MSGPMNKGVPEYSMVETLSRAIYSPVARLASGLAIPWACAICGKSGVADPSLARLDIDNLTFGWVYHEIEAQHRYVSPECARSEQVRVIILAGIRLCR